MLTYNLYIVVYENSSPSILGGIFIFVLTIIGMSFLIFHLNKEQGKS